jgi:hypothetical protein
VEYIFPHSCITAVPEAVTGVTDFASVRVRSQMFKMSGLSEVHRVSTSQINVARFRRFFFTVRMSPSEGEENGVI